MRSFVLLIKCYGAVQSKFGGWGACSTYWGEKYVHNFGGENRIKQTLENLGVDGTIILKWNLNLIGECEQDLAVSVQGC